MSAISNSMAALRIFGDELDPEEISRLLSATPSDCHRKGEAVLSSSGRRYVRKTGMWCLEASGESPDSLQSQILRVLTVLSADQEAWRILGHRFEIDMFCGLFMAESSEGLDISAVVMGLLAERGIPLAICIYGADGPPLEPDDLCPCRSGISYGDCCASRRGAEQAAPPNAFVADAPSASVS